MRCIGPALPLRAAIGRDRTSHSGKRPCPCGPRTDTFAARQAETRTPCEHVEAAVRLADRRGTRRSGAGMTGTRRVQTTTQWGSYRAVVEDGRVTAMEPVSVD